MQRATPACYAGMRASEAGGSAVSQFTTVAWTADKCGRLKSVPVFQKGGDPAAPSDTATLLRLHPSHEPCRGNRPPCG
jgi:hypothetical protein